MNKSASQVGQPEASSQVRTPPSELLGNVMRPSHFRNLLASWQPCLVFVIVHCRKSNLPVFRLEVRLWKDALGCIQRGPASWAGMGRGVATPEAGLGTKGSSVAASQGWGGHVSGPTRNVGPAGLWSGFLASLMGLKSTLEGGEE